MKFKKRYYFQNIYEIKILNNHKNFKYLIIQIISDLKPKKLFEHLYIYLFL